LRFEYYHNNWLDVSNYVNFHAELNVNLDTEFFDSLRFDADSLKTYKIDAVNKLLPSLGSKPAICFSGGIDSQITWHCFNEANIDIDVYVLVFKDDLNIQDVSHAMKFADKHKFKINYIEIDVLNFLSRENAEYGKKYKSLSPHFNTHYKLCDILRSKGYTGFVCGGGTPLLTENVSLWGNNYSQNFLNYINYSEISETFCQGNFLGFYPHLAWAVTLLTPSFINETYGKDLNLSERFELESQRYKEKIQGYTNSKFDVIPQKQKYTGFELIKDKLQSDYGDGWAFEKFYRYPLRAYAPDIRMIFKFDQSVVEKIKQLNLKNTRPGFCSPSGI
jgi:hypothetical protein